MGVLVFKTFTEGSRKIFVSLQMFHHPWTRANSGAQIAGEGSCGYNYKYDGHSLLTYFARQSLITVALKTRIGRTCFWGRLDITIELNVVLSGRKPSSIL